ncbi:MAG: restriction endonuclease subunit S [Ignavibacteriales bacterium]|nr:restriction endonuclease subunit S [Ignavibacteriales bacterium]
MSLLGYSKYKKTEYEWLGDIPEHWEVLKLGFLIRTKSGDYISNEFISKENDNEFPYPVVGGNGILAYTSFYNSTNESIIIGRVGAQCGNIHLFNKKCWITDNALIVTYSIRILIEYLKYLLIAMNLNEMANKNAQPLVTGEMIRSKITCLPPLEEQQSIAQFLDYKTEQIDKLVEKKEKLLKLLEEKRIALITNAVTGKLNDTILPLTKGETNLPAVCITSAIR